jgi:plastocyanin
VSFNVPVANQFVAALYQFLALEDYYIDVSVYASPSTPTSAGSNSYAGVWSTVTGNAFSIPLAGTAAVVSPEWESIPLGTHAVRFCADLPTESLAESNEGNNCGPSLTFSVGEGEGDGAVDISASPWLVRTGRTTTVTWSATGEFDSCVVSGAGLSSSEPNGTAVVTVTKEGTYTISCTQGETTVSDSVSVRLVPKFLEF